MLSDTKDSLHHKSQSIVNVNLDCFNCLYVKNVFVMSSVHTIWIGIVFLLTLNVNGISCEFIRDGDRSEDFGNFETRDDKGQSEHLSLNQKKNEPATPVWDVVSPRIFFLTSPPYQIRLRQEESQIRDRDTIRHSHQPDLEPLSTKKYPIEGQSQRYGHPGYSPNNHHMITNQMLDELGPVDSISAERQQSGNESPAYTPLIGARALSNMGKFFEHLRENLNAIQFQVQSQKTRGSNAPSNSENSMVENIRLRQELLHNTDSHFLRKNYLGDTSQSKKLQLRSSSTDPLTSNVRWRPPVTRFYYRDAVRSSPLQARAVLGSESKVLLTRRIDPESLVKPKAKENAKLDQGLSGHLGDAGSAIDGDPLRSATQTYNPSWSWTKLGLGKRRES